MESLVKSWWGPLKGLEVSLFQPTKRLQTERSLQQQAEFSAHKVKNGAELSVKNQTFNQEHSQQEFQELSIPWSLWKGHGRF